MRHSWTHHHESGQILLITLLVLTIATTVVLSLIGRTTTDVSISNQIAESSRAFSAAEAGIEASLKSGTTGVQTLSGATSFDVQRADIGNAAGIYQFPKKVVKGTTETLWLVDHNANGSLDEHPTFTASSLDLCWSSESTIPAMEVTVLYKTAPPTSEYRVAKGAYDPDPDGARRSANNFSTVTAATGGCGVGTNTTYRQRITFGSFFPVIDPTSDTLLMLRVQPVYSDAAIVVSTVAPLPLQGTQITSTGSSGTGVSRKIVVFQQFRSPPSIFDSVIYSQGSF
ncbi:hypothetical protein A2973_03080 [Candidatus Gottesmanbacteria bacterium RIFCSPLOWO2_01_FULL_49_10]|uniref:Type 4 fimbrial biogenesis protein PilX N-terminal domain-containing protein n=1 Tax=Candidatus Gottesmanbacteria bacterium RIFCSPLOWO2_01_FULL_49_10 TaxID=1798396 RepID=A0A1F6B1D4_9BACT|nr:MAG: hypothetical protein A2973_03080 [Candidatus Gottesmanbacteria bacterium RIFCSPLOWO2_01_FULL_49_10]